MLKKEYIEIHIQWPCLDKKIGLHEILVMKIQIVGTCLGASFTNRIYFFLKNTKSQKKLWYFKDSPTNCLWANFGKF
jgi:hypothetical protein